MKTLLKKLIAWVPMHAAFIVGDGVSRIMIRCHEFQDKSPGIYVFRAMYAVYNRCMLWSCDLNDWAGFTLWGDGNE